MAGICDILLSQVLCACSVQIFTGSAEKVCGRCLQLLSQVTAHLAWLPWLQIDGMLEVVLVHVHVQYGA